MTKKTEQVKEPVQTLLPREVVRFIDKVAEYECTTRSAIVRAWILESYKKELNKK